MAKKSWMSNEYSHGWQVDETIDSLNKLGEIPPLIVVGISILEKNEHPSTCLQNLKMRLRNELLLLINGLERVIKNGGCHLTDF